MGRTKSGGGAKSRLNEPDANVMGEMRGKTKALSANLTARESKASPAPQYAARDVKGIRASLRLSQAMFGAVLNVSPETVRSWEQGKKQPGGPAERLLEIAQKHPAVIQSVVLPRSNGGGK